ncbi:MAG: hypothetical protein RI936_30 [Pseudomonadota bacterium]|jgi:hypothetical protein
MTPLHAPGHQPVTPLDLPRRTAPIAHERVRERWSAHKRLAFETLEPISIALVATDGPVSLVLREPGKAVVRIGHNRGVWPAKIARGSTWRDAATAKYDVNPFFYVGTQVRLWVDSELAARTAITKLNERLADLDAEFGSLSHDLRNDFKALNPEIDLDLFEAEMREVIQRCTNCMVWDDDELSRHLDLLVAKATPKVAAKGARKGRA